MSFHFRFDLLTEIESNPDRWFRDRRIQQELESVETLSKIVGSASVQVLLLLSIQKPNLTTPGKNEFLLQDIVYVDSTTTGINIVLKSLKLAPDDIIVATNHTYGATRKAATEATNR